LASVDRPGLARTISSLRAHARRHAARTLGAWELARAWPGAELIVIEDSGHTGSMAMREALDAFADRLAATIARQAEVGRS
jgi:proline iminopeptidase